MQQYSCLILLVAPKSAAMKPQVLSKPAPNGLPKELKEMPIHWERVHIVDAQFITALRSHARRNGWVLKTRRADLFGNSFGVWRVG
jgi:hypothetical protein